ncbi:kinase-like domain-containing protein [Thelonectria olida]|uniref:non-specific serine/threonine protein kinase n=1 Tax=Thelonectria olida TaxID=1576542 RepID=A0A9P8W0V5_9HYPO|nr:kinase-like domain-containing protein [Thelonectria olida]
MSEYETIVDDIYGQILDKLERNDELRFVADGAAEAILRPPVLLKFFASLGPLDMELTPDEFVGRIQRRELHRFLAVLIYASCGIGPVRLFVRRLVANDAWPVLSAERRRLDSLPAHLNDLTDLFDGDAVTADKVNSKQACFCPISIGKQASQPPIQDFKSRRLPYLEDPEEIGKGSFGTVYKVRIARGYFYDLETGEPNSVPKVLAKKDYVVKKDPKNRAKDEHAVMKKLLHSTAGRCPYILESSGSLEDDGIYSLFMPLAECDLGAWMERHPCQPQTTEDKSKILKCAYELASGLDYLHTSIQSANGMEDLVCYHMDLKPSNILVFEDTREGADPGSMIWKLSDFGMACVKVRPQGKADERDEDAIFNFGNWFVKRNQTPEPTPSATINKRGDGTYLAPESRMKESSDVWSLACVLSVLFTYLEHGKDGVVSYRELRATFPRADGLDRFFIRGGAFTHDRVHPRVSKWHAQLIKKAQERNSQERVIVERFLSFLESSVFKLNPSKRSSAKTIQKELQKASRAYWQLQRTAEGEEAAPAPNTWWNRVARRRPPSNAMDVAEIWRTPAPKPFKGCGISSDGTVVVFWTDNSLVTFTAQSLPRQGDGARPVAELPLPETPSLRRSAWEFVSLTSRYLIASVVGSSLLCHIFEIEAGIPIEGYLLSLPQLGAIEKLAISPNGRVLACVLSNNGKRTDSHVLFHAKIRDLIGISQRLDLANPSNEPRAALDPNGEPWALIQLDSLAEIVIELTFSSEDYLYTVVKPDHGIPGSRHITTMTWITLSSGAIYTLDMKVPLGRDAFHAVVPFFTTFAPFHRGPPACAVVTREEDLHILHFDAEHHSGDKPRSVAKHELLSLMMDPSDEKMYAIGKRSVQNGLLVLEIPVPSPHSDPEVTEIARIPGLTYGAVEFTSRLVTDGDEKHIIMAALAGGNQSLSTICRVDLLT